ncbi:hypothetical protein LCGC14_0788660 [marine sediment metagenome]|uniref:Uncharacterized protein n=1 Tax=marine sediment metagenome TaxID=412755 RepID=A0A0F9PTB9_9ZZZZ
MATIYKIRNGSDGGRGWCGHKMVKGELYYLVDGRTTAKAYCRECGDKAGIRGRDVSVEELLNMGVLNDKTDDVPVQEGVGTNIQVAVGGVVGK